MKKLLAILFAAVLCIALGVTAWAATEVTVAGVELSLGEYLNESGTKVTSPTDNYAHFHTVGSEYVLTLKNYDYSVSSGAHHCITWSGDLVIELPAGTTSNVTNGYTATGTGGWGSDDTVAIQGEGNNTLTIKGPGSLNATGYMHAIWATSSITVTGGATVNATATITADKDTDNASIALSTNRNGKITVDGANVTATGNVYGIGYSNNNSGTLIVTGDSNVTAKGGVKAILGDATLGGMIVTASTEVNGTLGEYEAAKLGSYKYINIVQDPTVQDYGIVLENGTIKDTDGNSLSNIGITASGDATDGYVYTFDGVNFKTTYQYAIEIKDTNAEIVLKNSNTVKGFAAQALMSGIEHDKNGTLKFSGSGTLDVTAGEAVDTGDIKRSSYGIYGGSGNIVISGSVTINAAGGKAGENSIGIRVYSGTVTVSNTAKVTATGGNYGIWASTLDLSGLAEGGKVTAKATTGNAIRSTTDSLPANWKYINAEDNSTYSSGSGTSIPADLKNGSYLEIAKADAVPTTYTVTYNINGGTGTVPTDSAEYASGTEVIVKSGEGLTIADEYQIFVGWNTAANGSGTTYEAGEKFNISENTTLYAEWDAKVEIGGVAVTSSNKSGEGWSYDLATKTLTLQNYDAGSIKSEIDLDIVLKGENTVTTTGKRGINVSKNLTIKGEGTLNVTAGDVVRDNVTIHSQAIYAVENIEILSGTVNANGGKATGDDCNSYAIRSKDESVTISGTAIVTATGGESGDYSHGIRAEKNITVSGSAKVIAIGGPATNRSFGFRAGGTIDLSGLTDGNVAAKGGTANVLGEAMNDTTILLPTSWKYKDNADDAEYTNGTTLTDTLKNGAYLEIAQGKVTYTVTLHANDGSSTTTDITGVSGSYDLPTCTFTAPEGKQFKGWATSAAGEVISETSITVNKDTVLYAIWEDIPVTTYTVSFDANGGSGTMNAVTVEAGEYTLPDCTFTAPESGMFKGWATSKDGEVIEKITVTKDITLYAQWSIGVGDDEESDPDPKPETKPEACDHKFDANGKCSRCGVIVISYPRDEAEANPNTGAPAVNGFAAIAVLAAGAICLGKRK